MIPTLKKNHLLLLATICLMQIMSCQNSDNKKPPASGNEIEKDLTREAMAAEAAPLDTITSLKDQKDSAYFKAPNGQVYKVHLADQNGREVSAATYEQKVLDSLYCITDLFLGTERKNAKSSFLLKTIKFYNTVAALKATLAADSVMRNLSPPITTAINSPRVLQEKRNVNLKTAFIYAISREDDNDFHMIIGDTLPFNAAKAINVELAGLPNPVNASTDTITKVRIKTEAFFGEKCSGAYTVFTPPIKVSVTGSLLYDIGHTPGSIGTGIYKPQTSWEIHPLSDIIFK